MRADAANVLFDELWNDRVGFVKHILNVTPTDQQGDALRALDEHEAVSVASGHGCGKAQPADILVDTPQGTRRFGDLVPGDYVFGLDGKPTEITSVHERGILPVFKVEFDDGSATEVCGDHLWLVFPRNRRGGDRGEAKILSTIEIIKHGVKRKNGKGITRNFALPQHGCAEYPFRWAPVEPYALGVWLGDGSRGKGSYTSADPEIAEEIKDAGQAVNYGGIKRDNKAATYNIRNIPYGLQALGLYGCYSYEKFVPDLYKFNIIPIRLAVLQGLMDTDGWCGHGRSPSFFTSSPQLAKDVAWLVRSLGGKAKIRGPKRTGYKAKNHERVQGRSAYEVVLNFHNGTLPFRLKRKNDRRRNLTQRYTHRWIEKIELIGEADCRCITVEAKDGIYLTNDFIATHNSGVMSWSLLHYMNCRPFPKIPCTAPTKHQLYDVLWAELSKWHRKMKEPFRNQFQWTKEKFFHKAHPEEWFAAARTATKENPEALQGFHADYVLILIDEASGVPNSTFEVLDGAHGMIETKLLMGGNPTRRDGAFFDSHHKLKDLYRRLIWSCLNSSIVPEKFPIKIEKKFGKNSNIYRVRVLGLFPLHSDDVFIPYELAEAALMRDVPPQIDHPLIFGVDVARFGDDSTVIARRRGDEFLKYDILRNKSTMEVAGYVAKCANAEKPRHIFIDVIGLGAGVYDRLYELNYPAIPVNVSESPAINGQEYKRLRDELWGQMRSWLETRRGKLWDNEDGDLIGELTTPTFKFTSNGLYLIESKESMKKRGFQSPNVADAHIMTFAQPTAAYQIPGEDDYWEQFDPREEYRPLDPWAGY